LLLPLAGCAVLTPAQRQAYVDGGLPAVAAVNTPFFPQQAHQCGPAALATVLVWSGVDTTPQALTGEVYIPDREGSLQIEMIAAARRAGRVPYVLRPELKALLREVAAGHPVLVLQNLGLSWWTQWHYAVVVGYDLPGNTVVLNSGRLQGERLSLDTFLFTWQRAHDWAVVALPPTTLPATAEQLPYVKAVAGLERLHLWPAAEQGYRTALRRWPNSVAAWLGLGNARYAQGDVQGATDAFSSAVTVDPQSVVAQNNLASVLSEQGRLDAALTHAERAVALGRGQWPEAQQTLEQVKARLHSAR
jgi:tetratricopeptide (TPR) repeat protein